MSAVPPEPPSPNAIQTLECIECERYSDDGRGWRAYLYEEREVWIYCPVCAAREFDD